MALFKDLAQEEMGSWTVSRPGTVSYFIMNLNKYKEKKSRMNISHNRKRAPIFDFAFTMLSLSFSLKIIFCTLSPKAHNMLPMI